MIFCKKVAKGKRRVFVGAYGSRSEKMEEITFVKVCVRRIFKLMLISVLEGFVIVAFEDEICCDCSTLQR